MRSILAAIGAALRAAFRTLRALASVPGRMIRSVLGFAPEDDYMPSPAPLDLDDDEAGPELSRQEYYGRASADVMSWAAESLIDDKPAPLPPGLPIEVSWWLPGLTREECEALINQDCAGISQHLQGIREIAGVRPVQALAPATWSASPRNEPADAVVITVREPATLAEPAQPSIRL